MGATPTARLKRSKKVERERPASFDSWATVQDADGLSCILRSAITKRASAKPRSNPGDAWVPTVDLRASTVTLSGTSIPFEIDAYTRWRLLEGLDDIGLTLRDEARITAFEAGREAWRPTTLPVGDR